MKRAAPRARKSSASACPSSCRGVDVRRRRLRRRRAGCPCHRVPRAGRAATACLPPIRRRRRAAYGNFRPARARRRAPPWWRASCRNRPAAPMRRGYWRGRCGIRAPARPVPARAGFPPGSSSAAMRVPNPRRFKPAAARMMASYCAFVELAQARVDVAAQRLDSQMRDGARATALRGAGSTCRRRRPAGSSARLANLLDTNASRGSSRAVMPASAKPSRHFHRHVLQRMHGEVGAAVIHRHFELLDEQALAADRRQRLVEDAVALGRQAEQVDRHARIQRGEPRADVLGLPQRERRFAGRDAQSARHGCWGHVGSRNQVVPGWSCGRGVRQFASLAPRLASLLHPHPSASCRRGCLRCPCNTQASPSSGSASSEARSRRPPRPPWRPSHRDRPRRSCRRTR